MKIFSKKKVGQTRIIQLGPFTIKYTKKTALDKMKLGISYNIFDGEELLEASLTNMRPHAKHVNIVYQTISNHQKCCNDDLIKRLNYLKDKGLVDKLIHYTPNFNQSPTVNERNKRNIGLEEAIKNKCSHFMTMDADEFFYPEQLIEAKKTIIENNLDATSCMCYNYATPKIRHRSPYLAGGLLFIFKIKKHRRFTDCFFPMLVDPTRKIKISGKFYCFSPHQLIMHHYTYVRHDITKKWLNSSSCTKENYEEISSKAQELEKILSGTHDQILSSICFPYCGGLRDGDAGVQEVPDYFNIEKYINN